MPSVPIPGIRSDFLLSVGAGIIPGYTGIRKFGHNPDIDTAAQETIWTPGGIINYPSDSGEGIEIISSNAGDTVTIFIEGLDSNFDEQEETLTLNGLTAVVSTKTWTRINRGFNSSSTELLGDVTVRDSTTSLITFAQIRAEEQQTSMATYTVPNGKTGLIVGLNAAMNKAVGSGAAADIFLLTREIGMVFREKLHAGIAQQGSSEVDDPMSIPEMAPGKTDIKIEASVSANNSDISAWFYIVVIEDGRIF